MITNDQVPYLRLRSASQRFFFIILLPALIASLTPLEAQDHSTTLVFPTKSHAPLRKATGTHLFFAVGNATDVSNPQGTAVTKLQVLDDPESEEDDDELTVYGVNAGKNEIIYNTSLINIEIFHPETGTTGAFHQPRGIAANTAGDVFVADKGNRRIVWLRNPDGKHLEFRGSSRPDAENFQPFDVAISQNNTVFVTDSLGHKIWRYFPDQDRWDVLNSTILTPLGITVYDHEERWTRHRNTSIGVVTANGTAAAILDLTGRLRYTYKPEDNSIGFRYIAVDYYENYYITDARNSRIVKIDRQGRFVDYIGNEGRGDYQFLHPQGISIWKRFGQVCIAESYAAQYYLIGTDILRPSLDVEHGYLDIRFQLTERADITITLDSAVQDTVYELIEDRRISQGKFRYRWSIPESLPAGSHTISISAVPSYSSTKYFTATREIVWQYDAAAVGN